MMIHLYLYDLRVYIFFLGGGGSGEKSLLPNIPIKKPWKIHILNPKIGGLEDDFPG